MQRGRNKVSPLTGSRSVVGRREGLAPQPGLLLPFLPRTQTPEQEGREHPLSRALLSEHIRRPVKASG